MTGSADIKFKASYINECYVVEEADEYFLPLPNTINGHDVVVVHPKKIEINCITFLFDDANKCWMPLDLVSSELTLPKYKYFYPVKTSVDFKDINTEFKEPPDDCTLADCTGDGYDLLFKRLIQST